MHNSFARQDAYQLLLVQNVLSSMAKRSSGNQESKCDGVVDHDKQNPVRGKFCHDKDYHHSEAISDRWNEECENNVILNKERTDERFIRFRSSKRLSGKTGYIVVPTENEEGYDRDEQTEKKLINQQRYLKLCHIRKQRYFLVSEESRMPVVAFSHLPYSRERLSRSYSQSEDPNRLSVASSFYTRIRPINYKQTQELSFRDMISTSMGNTSSEDNSPLPSRKHNDGDDRSSNISSCASTQRYMSSCDIIRATVEEPLLLHSALGDPIVDTNLTEYDPNLIANFDSDCGTRKTVMKFSGYTSITMHYQPHNEAKRLINEAFRSRFPQVHISFSKINSIKRELHHIAVACNLEDATTAHAYVFYEKGLVCKTNRKLVAGAALLIAAKITDFGSLCISDVVNCLESSLRINRKELLRYEIPLCAALNFDLRVPLCQLLPHYQRIALTLL